MTWDKIEAFLRSQGRSDAAIAYACTRYNDDDKSEYSQLVRYTYGELARAFDAARMRANPCEICYELRDDGPNGFNYFLTCNRVSGEEGERCSCRCHEGQVWLA